MLNLTATCPECKELAKSMKSDLKYMDVKFGLPLKVSPVMHNMELTCANGHTWNPNVTSTKKRG